MDTAEISLIGADRLRNSLIIAFSNGRIGNYSTDLLYATLSLAEELFESDDSDTEKSDAEDTGSEDEERASADLTPAL